MIRVIFVIFVLSGFVGLMYEAVWSRYLKLLLGHSSAGQILTLAIFMGGLGLGSFLVGRFIHRIRRPLMAYAMVEGTAGIMGWLYHPIYTRVCDAYFNWATGAELSYALQVTAKLGICLATTLPVAILLGMTFPLIAVGVMRHITDHGSKSLSYLYFTNSLGAAAGIVVTSYFFIRLYGTPGTLMLAGTGNVLIALIMFAISRRWENASLPSDAPVQAPAPAIEEHAPLPVNVPVLKRADVSIWLGIAALTGFASFIYEVGWIRLVSLLMGSSTHSFDIMVSAFVLGLACGGLYSRRLIAGRGSLAMKLGVVQVLMGLFALATIFWYKPAILFVNELHQVFAKTEAAYAWYSLVKYLLCLVIMFPASFCAGITLPLITYVLINGRRTEKYTGYVYGFNTIGSILGASLAGYLLLPLLQLKWAIASGALLDMFLGVFLLWRYIPRPSVRIASAGLMAAAALSAVIYQFDPLLLNLGTYRLRIKDLSERALDVYRKDMEIHTRDGRTATIALTKTPYNVTIRTNGKSDGNTATPLARSMGQRGDDATMAGVAFLPMRTRTEPYDAAIIGMGTGLSAHFLLSDPLVQRLDLIEIEKEVLNLSRHFRPLNERAFADPRINFIVDDAKSYFYNNDQLYDLIISEPSNPWVSGVSSLFTQEFYHHVRRFIRPKGLLVQWLHTYEFEDELFLTILKALDSQFADYLLFTVPECSDVVIIASQEPLDPAIFSRVLDAPGMRSDFARYNWPDTHFSNAQLIATSKSLAPLLEYYNANSDYFPVVDEMAERAFFRNAQVTLPQLYGNTYPNIGRELDPRMQPASLGESALILRRAATQLDPASDAALKLAISNLNLPGQERAFEQLFYPRFSLLAGTPDWEAHPVVNAYRRAVELPDSPLSETARLRFALVDGYTTGNREALARAVPELMKTQPPGDLFWDRALALGAYRLGSESLLMQIINQRWPATDRAKAQERSLLIALTDQLEPR